MDGRVTWRALPPNKRFEQGEILGWFTSSELLSLTRQLTKTSLESEAGSLLAQRLQNLGFSQTAIRAIAKGQSPATDKLTLHMPQTGRLNEWLVASDEVLRQNQPLLAWEKDAGVHLNVSVPVNAAMALQLGQRVQVEGVDAPLAIDFMGEEVSPYSQSLEMGVLLPNEVETLRIGQLVAVDVLKEQPAYRIAQTAVVEVEGKAQVYAINGSQVEPVVVELLARDGESAWVTPMQAGVGLKQLVTRGTALLKAYQMGE
jgi:hypothetical protein